MFFVYYWVREVETDEKSIICLSDFAGDIGDIIIVRGKKYIIDDLSAEYEDFDEPEDF